MFSKTISWIIPCYYSEKTIEMVVDMINEAFPPEVVKCELILVNDGSTDSTWEVISKLVNRDKNITGINLMKNFGQDAALMAGFAKCSGDYIIALDDDGQNPPEEAWKLIMALEAGSDVAFGKYVRKKDSQFKTWGSWLNDKMATYMINKPADLQLCSYFAIKSNVVREIVKNENAFPYIWGLVLRSTDRITNVVIEHKERTIGKSTYTLHKLISYWLNGFTAFSIKPLRIASLAGGLIALTGFAFAGVFLLQKIVWGISIEGWTSLMVAILVLGGMILCALGVLGEYVGRIYMCINKQPQYIIRDVLENKQNDK